MYTIKNTLNTDEKPLNEAQFQAVVSICIRARVLCECYDCRGIFSISNVLDNAYKLGNDLFAENNTLISPFYTCNELMDAIQKVHSQSMDRCYCPNYNNWSRKWS